MKEAENWIQKELFEEIEKENKMNKDFLSLHKSDKKNSDFPYIDAEEFEKKVVEVKNEHSDSYYEKMFLKILEKFGD